MNKQRLPQQILTVLACRILLNTARRFIYPFAPALSRGLDVPLTAITSVIALSQVSSLLGLFSGPLADRFGYRLMMRTSLAVLAAGMLLCGIAATNWAVFAGLIVASLGKTIFDPAIQAFIGHHVPYERRSRVIGLLETTWAASALVGIPALGLIIAEIGLRGSFVLFALLGCLGWLALGFFIPADTAANDGRGKRERVWSSLVSLLRQPATAGMLAFGFCISLANDTLFVTFGAWFESAFQVGITTLGFSTVAIGAAELLGESSTALFSDRLGPKRALALGISLSILSYLLLPLIGRTLPLAMIGMFSVFLFYEFTIVTSFTLCTELLPEARATMMSGFYAAAGVGRMLGVLLGGALWSRGGILAVTAAAALLSFLGLLALLHGLRGWRSAPAASPPGR